MAYRRPNALTSKVFNKLAMRFGLSGTQVLAVRGRSTGTVHRVPVIPVEHAGASYLVSPRGESQWVRNLRAAGGACSLGPHGAPVATRAVEVPVEERAPVLDAYQELAGRAVSSHFAALPDPADHPTLRLAAAGPGDGV